MLLAFQLDLAPGQEEDALESGVVHVFRPPDQQLRDEGHGAAGFFAQLALIDGHLAPADDGDVALVHHALSHELNAEAGGLILGKEEHADAEVELMLQLHTEFFDLREEELVGDLGEDTSAITSLHVSLHGPAVHDGATTAQGVIKNFATTFTIHLRYKAHTAGVAFHIHVMERAFIRNWFVVIGMLGHVATRGCEVRPFARSGKGGSQTSQEQAS